MIVECTYGPVSTEVMGTVYTFQPDEHGRNVAEVWNPKHLEALCAVIHYQVVKRDPDPLELTELVPSAAQIGDADVTLSVIGTGFSKRSLIVFNGGVESTVYVSGELLTTIVKPSLASVAGSYPVLVRDSTKETGALDFSFTEPDVPEVDAPEGEGEPEEEPTAEEEPVEEASIAVTEISGIGPTTAAKLADIGVTDARQIATWSEDVAASIDAQLGLGGKIARDGWVEQAKALIA